MQFFSAHKTCDSNLIVGVVVTPYHVVRVRSRVGGAILVGAVLVGVWASLSRLLFTSIINQLQYQNSYNHLCSDSILLALTHNEVVDRNASLSCVSGTCATPPVPDGTASSWAPSI